MSYQLPATLSSAIISALRYKYS